MIDPHYTATGFAVGALAGLTGIGGGALMTPILILLFGIHPAVAVGTDLLCASMTKTGGTLAHALSRTVDWRTTGTLAAGSVPAAATTLFVPSHVHNVVDAGYGSSECGLPALHRLEPAWALECDYRQQVTGARSLARPHEM